MIVKISRAKYKQAIRLLRLFTDKFDADQGFNLSKPLYSLPYNQQQKFAKYYRNLPKIISQYKSDIKELRRYSPLFCASCGYNLVSPGKGLTKRKRDKYLLYKDQLRAIRARPHREVRPLNKQRLKNLQIFSRHPRPLLNFNTAFVPVADPYSSLKVVYNKKNEVVKIIQGGITTQEYFFDPINLIDNPAAEVQNAIDQLEGNRYKIMAGEYMVHSLIASDANELTEQVTHLMNKYSEQKYDSEDPNSSYWENWLLGVVSYDLPKSGSRQRFITALNNIRKIQKELRNKKTSEKRRKELLKQLEKFRLKR